MSIDTKRLSWTEQAGYSSDPIPFGHSNEAEYFEQEKELIFKKTWINIGRVSSIPNTGDYFVQPFVAGDTSILVTRANDGKVRAFHNMCSHRCNQVVWNSHGNEDKLKCRFHGWTYGLDGRLLAATDATQIDGFDRATMGLTPVHVDVWEDFIWINLSETPSETLREHLGDFYDGLAGYPFHELTQTYEWTLDLACNWKIFRDAFLEVYHVPYLHGPSVGNAFQSPENPFNHALFIALNGDHSRMSLYGNPNYVPNPVAAIANRFANTIGKQESRPDVTKVALMNPTASDSYSGDIFPVFPNTHMFLMPGLMLYHNYWPISADHTIVQLRQCQPKPTRASQRFGQEYAKVMNRDSSAEDINTVELTHAMLKSGAKTEYIFTDQELMVRHSHMTIQKYAGPYVTSGKTRDIDD